MAAFLKLHHGSGDMIAFSVLCDGAIRLTEYVIHFSGFDESKAGSRLQPVQASPFPDRKNWRQYEKSA